MQRDPKIISKERKKTLKSLNYNQMRNSLITNSTNLNYVIKEEFRHSLVILYTAEFCNYCIRIKSNFEKVSQMFETKDYLYFDRFDLDENDFDFLDFDKVPLVMFYPKGFYEKRKEIYTFDKDQNVLSEEVIYKQIRKLMKEYKDEKK